MAKFKSIIFVIIINVILLGSIELCLRLFHIGDKTSVLIKHKTGKSSVLSVNQSYLNQYYSKLSNSIPSPYNQSFSPEKADSVFRVYVIGESTSQGFPYSKLEAFPFQLETMLNSISKSTGKKVEVINFSIAAINSYVGKKITNEIINYPPDLLISYFGNNEFIGIGGATSSRNVFFKLNETLSQVRIYQAIKLLIFHISSKNEKSNISTFEQMAEKGGIATNSPSYKKTLLLFKENYYTIIETCQEKNIPVLLLGMVVNLKDLPPLKSDDKLSEEMTNKINNLLTSEITQQNINKLIEAAGDNATANYSIGRKLLEVKKSEYARIFFQHACDFDMLKFRATSDVQEIIKQISIEKNCDYIDLQQLFDKQDSIDITGNSLLCEHVHPLIQGHTIIADTLARMISKKYLNVRVSDSLGFSKVKIKNSLVDHMLALNCLERMYSTKLYKDIHYTNKYAEKQLYDIESTPIKLKEEIDKEAYQYLTGIFGKGFPAEQMHVNYGTWMLLNGRPTKEAVSEFEIALLINPECYEAMNNIAAVEYRLGSKQKAFDMLYNLLNSKKEKLEVIEQNLLFMARDLRKVRKLDKLNNRNLNSKTRLKTDRVKIMQFS